MRTKQATWSIQIALFFCFSVLPSYFVLKRTKSHPKLWELVCGHRDKRSMQIPPAENDNLYLTVQPEQGIFFLTLEDSDTEHTRQSSPHIKTAKFFTTRSGVLFSTWQQSILVFKQNTTHTNKWYSKQLIKIMFECTVIQHF